MFLWKRKRRLQVRALIMSEPKMNKEEADKIISTYFSAKDEVHSLLGYKPDWVEIPMEDSRKYYWMLTDGEESGSCAYSPEPFTVESIEAGSKMYGGSIYTQRHLPKWVYRTETHVMVSVDTHTDGNRFLMIFDASKECTDDAMKKLYKDYWG